MGGQGVWACSVMFCKLDTRVGQKEESSVEKRLPSGLLAQTRKGRVTVWNVTTGQAVMGYTRKKLDKPWGANQ